MKAARERHVFCIPDPWLNTPAPTLLQGLPQVLGGGERDLEDLPDGEPPDPFSD